MRWQAILLGVLGIALVYPVALAAVIAVDTWAGEAEFLRQFLFVSKWHAAMIMASDWWSSLPVVIAGWLLVRGAQGLLGLRIASWSIGLLAVAGIVMAFVPPYLPMVFATMLLTIVVLNLLAERHFGRH